MRMLLGVILLFSIAGMGYSQTPAHPEKLIIDQDTFGPGGSNLQAILMALQAPDVEVLGITVESGDGWQDENVAHLLRMLELIGRTDIKVYRGATYPLINSAIAARRREAIFGKIAYKGAWTEEFEKYNDTNRMGYHDPQVIPPMREGKPYHKAETESGISFMLREVHQYPNEVTIMALGPETNIALAVRLDDDFAKLAKEIVLEGASLNPKAVPGDPFAVQYVNTPRVCTNFWWDPEAAHIVLHAPWKKMMVVPIDATVDTKLTSALVSRAAHTPGKSETTIQKYLEAYANINFPMWDEAAFAIWLHPDLVRQWDILSLDVDTNSTGSNYGGTLSWTADKGPGLGEARAHVVREIHVPAFEQLFMNLISR